MDEAPRTNRLAGETSPYLLQHAHNPVDWYPWGPEALERARSEDRPILLSIGYAACHWCHVMERESFEDESTAALMNEHFVPVKVDREERPDLDAIYMDAVQAMTGSGGWPMTVFLTPDGSPFYAGTYFPPEDRHGIPSFKKVLGAIAETWSTRRGDAEEQGRRVAEGIGRTAALRPSDEPLTDDILRRAAATLRRGFDPEWGGFGGAPKFPQPMTLEFLLRAASHGYDGALEMVERTLDRMAHGGIYDQVGGGFHRYAVDGRWHVPHFEKMLYDNAQLARLYTHAWQVTRKPLYRRIARETLEYLLLEMRHPDGGFFSSQDADSEGEEGKFFVWDWLELVELVGEPVAAWFGARPEGNWEGRNVLWVPRPEEVAPDEASLAEARRRLFEVRSARVTPATDDKVLAAWNGLAVVAFAEAGRAFDEPRYVDAASDAADFVLSEMRDGGRLLRSWRAGRPGRPGYLEDYAAVASACLTLFETSFEPDYFREARNLADDTVRLFADHAGGGFFQTGSDSEALVVRPKELFDNAVPAGGSVAAEVLQRLAYLTGDFGYEQAGVSALRLVRDLMLRAPSAFGHALGALDLFVSPVREVAIVGDPGREETRSLVREVHGRFLPNLVLAAAAPGDEGTMNDIPLLSGRTEVGGRPTAYVCERFVCQLPVTEPEALAAQLGV
jgi:uncharacterized protein